MTNSLEPAAGRALAALRAISAVVVSQSGEHLMLAAVLEALEQRVGIRRGTIALATAKGSEVVAELGGEAGEGRDDFQLVCVPVTCRQETVGSLAAEIPRAGPIHPAEAESLLVVVASMIAGDLQRMRADSNPAGRLGAAGPAGGRVGIENLVGASRVMSKVRQTILEVAPRDTSVLVWGEPGTGKGLVAAAIHQSSRRARGPLLKIDCTALNETAVRRKRFGYVQRTLGRTKHRPPGGADQADGVTLLLDEVGGLSPSAQLAVLGLLRECELGPDFDRATPSADARIVATTSRNLEPEIRKGTFRRDLYCRISVLLVVLPPLRNRLEDVWLLAEHFLRRGAVALGKPVPQLSGAALDALLAYDWPENVREFEHCLAHALAGGDDPVIHPRQLPPFLWRQPSR